MGVSGFCGMIDHLNNGQNHQNLANQLQQLYLGLIDDLGAQKTTTGECWLCSTSLSAKIFRFEVKTIAKILLLSINTPDFEIGFGDKDRL